MITGLPGLIATPWISTSPSSAITSAVKSRVPADEPAETITRSFAATASRIRSRISAYSSGVFGYRVHRHPRESSQAEAKSVFDSTTWPGSGRWPCGISSEPVGTNPTRTVATSTPAMP